VGETHGNDASRKGSALVGAEPFDPCGVGRKKGGGRPWGGGHKKRALAHGYPTRTPSGLRGCDAYRDKKESRENGVPALRDPTHQAARLRAVSDPYCESVVRGLKIENW